MSALLPKMQTSPGDQGMSIIYSGRVETFFVAQKLHVTGRDGASRRDRLSLFLLYRVRIQLGATWGRAGRDERSQNAYNMTRCSCPDRREERFDTDDVHHAREVVGEHVQRHLSRHFGSVFIRKCVAPIRIFRVANGCSTVSRRTRMACGF